MSAYPDETRSLALRLSALSPARRAVVERLSRERQRKEGLVPLPVRTGLAKASFGQQRLWFMGQLDASSPVYNTVNSTSLASPVDVTALQNAVEILIERHESLRTTFETVDGEPFQRVQNNASVVVEVGDATDEFVRRPFDLQRGPLLRVRVATDTGRVVVCMHHIVTDGWSMGIFLRELSALYGGLVRGVPVALPPLPIQYRDYAAWQRAELSGSRLSGLLDFWRTEMADLPEFDLVTDRPRPAVWSFRGGTVPLRVPADLVMRLRALMHEQGATLFMALLAGFSVLLARYSGNEELIIGCPVAGRTRSETEGLIGFFINVILLRCDLRGDPSFRELLTRTRDRAVRAYAHQELPFEKLVEALQPKRDLSRNPLHQVVLHLIDSSTDEVWSDDDLHGITGTSPYDLAVHLRAGCTDLKGNIEYSSELFDRSSVQRLAEHFLVVIDALTGDPDAPLSRVRLMTPHEERQLESLRAITTPIPSHGAVASIDAQAARTPDALAVDTVTYSSLVRAANGVAHDLLARGATRDAIVAVSLPRGSDLAVALLGIWKAGAAYLPLDPDDPPTRRRQILSDARPLLVLDNPNQFAPPRPDFPAVPADPRRLAYAIYTSGSTGTPKGVLVEHASLSNLIAWHVSEYRVTAQDRATLIASPAFDASVWELWPYLTAGASVHVPSTATTRSPSGILAWLAVQRITMTFLPTPLAEAVLAEPMPEHLTLRFLLTGGDRLHRCPARGLPFQLANHYGPTETTVVATACLVPPGIAESQPPIGRPINNVQAEVFDRYGQPLPAGVPGELWIGGAGLARGYLRRSELTAERFAKRNGRRMYRTGDRVRRRPDGSLDFLGRLDEQLKLRGFRIEPGEIESHLQAHPSVRAAAVAMRRDRLVAYIVLASPLTGIDSLRKHLRDRLPNYMIPVRFEILEDLPITANGKIDRRALPSAISNDSIYVAPRTPVERTIAGIWARLLARERVGVYDDFFELGGHSLLATQAVSRIRSILGVELSVGAVFDAPTVASLAAVVARARPAGATTTQTIPRAPRNLYRARVGSDGMLVLDGQLRKLLHLEDAAAPA